MISHLHCIKRNCTHIPPCKFSLRLKRAIHNRSKTPNLRSEWLIGRDNLMKLGIQDVKPGSKKSVSSIAACLGMLQHLYLGELYCQTHKTLPSFRARDCFLEQHKHSVVLSRPEMQCLPRCSATQPQRSWERGVGGPLINIQLLSVSTHTHKYHIFTNTQSGVSHKHTNVQTCKQKKNLWAHLNI